MDDEQKTPRQLKAELNELRQQIRDLDALEADRAQREKMHREIEERLQILFEFAPDAYYLNDLTGTFVDGNRAVEKITGYKKEELIGQNFLKIRLLSCDQLPKAASLLAKNALGHVTGPDEFILNRKDGKQITVEIRTYPVKIQNQTLVLGIARDITERKHTEKTLRESEERFRRIIENAPSGYFRIGKDGLWQYVNAEWERMHGYSRQEIIGKHFDIPQPEDTAEQVRDIVKRALSGETMRGELGRRRKDGTIQYHSFSVQPVTQSGEIAALEGFINDITEHRKTEKELRKSEQRFRSLFENTPVSILEVDFSQVRTYLDSLKEEDTGDFETYLLQHPNVVTRCTELLKILEVNQAALELYGAPSEENLIENLKKTFTPASYEALRKELVAIWNGQSQMEIDATVQTLEGALRHVTVRWSVVPGHEETLSRILVSLADITDRKRAEEDLRQSEELYRTLVEGQGEGIGIVDDREFFTYANRAAERIFGVPKGTLVGRDLKDFVTPEQYTLLRRQTNRRQRKLKDTYELEIIRPDGERRNILITVSPQFGKSGEYTGAFGIFRDITDRKRAEKELAFKNVILSTQQETTLDGILIVDENGKMISFNNQFIRMWNICAEVAESKSDERALQFVLDKLVDPQGFLDRVHSLYANRVEKSREEIALVDGRTFDRYSTPMFGPDNQYYGRVWYFRDITERKRAEQERERLIEELQGALAKVKTLSGLIPICSSCKRIRDDKGYWNQIEAYIREHSEAEFSHGFCPDCMKKLYPDFAKDEEATDTTPF